MGTGARVVRGPVRATWRPLGARGKSTTVAEDIVARYEAKLAERMKAERVESLGELRDRYKDKIAEVRQAARVEPPAYVKPEGDEASEEGPLRERAPQIPQVAPKDAIKRLSSFVDVEKLRMHQDAKEIELIWRARFANDPHALCASVVADRFELVAGNARKYPMFVLPLPRGEGSNEMQFVQWTFPDSHTVHCLFTSLAEYKLHKEFARPHTTMIYHKELAESHGLVLINGSVEKDMSMGVTAADAQFLVLTLQKFYNSDPRLAEGAYEREKALRRRTLLELFKNGTDTFDLQRLIDEAEMAD
ncbi:ATP11 protein-domain-containing protein [Dipodascopsis tothii]|uniref:ATP11 protein-domain-containing protein n=1 Tax=Dipodascopsis tothii TaxID=44089 RepID=UPI0034CE6248